MQAAKGGAEASDAKPLSLSEILADGIALGFFLQYLHQHRASVNLTFWLSCRALQDTVERRGSAPAVDVLNCMEVSRSGLNSDTHVQVSEEERKKERRKDGR